LEKAYEIRGASMAEPDNTTIGERIKFIRGSLAKVEFARALGIYRNTLLQWETNKNFPDFERLQKIHKEFKVNPNWLISGKGKPYLKRSQPSPDIETRIIQMEARITTLEKKAKK
jgi:transcriptional regulator with XRE-family HTH domain